MTDQTNVTVTRTINASAADIFDALTNPERHAEFDGSGFVQSADRHAQRITGTGQMFRMNMRGDHMGGDYQTDNRVTTFHENKQVGWQTAPANTEPKGWSWTWVLEPRDAGATDVTLQYDWAQVTDPDLLKKVKFPLVSKDQLEDSLAALASAVE
ncbi:SRPBCC family protein [Mariniluteicoccus endophyticus]